ncbi:MAG: tRNA pseudouridine(55) synthase TruB [Desulfuromonadales bacterium]|nr:tRNA pseudouridine(55) synthase TruB [Desulfuromonadales bacterium]
MTGLLIIDKPQGMTSHDVVRRVRRLLHTRRVGHAGTLDPMATGVLQVAVGEATRLVEFLMGGEKSYRAVLKLGESTDTQDAEGTVLERRPLGDLDRQTIEAACLPLTGCIRQRPPMYSALKRNGVPLYTLARQGIEVERDERQVQINRLQVLEVQLPLVTLEVDCTKGTYIRTLAHDLGEALGCGAHLTALRRTRSGPFTAGESVALAQLEAEAPAQPPLIPLREALRGFPVLRLNVEAVGRLRNGIPPTVAQLEGELPEAGAVVLLLTGEELRAVARYAPLREEETRGDFVLLRVFHPPDA